MKLSQIKPNPSNPRTIKDEAFKKLCNSITEFPKMLALRPMVVDADGVILGGNMRYKALQHLGFKDIPDEWVRRADELTEDERRRFIIADNVSGGDWDTEDLAANWDKEELSEWGLEIPDWAAGVDANNMTDEDVSLDEDFGEIGSVDNFYRVTFIFENEKDADSWLDKQSEKYDVKKLGGMQGKRSLINLSVTYGK